MCGLMMFPGYEDQEIWISQLVGFYWSVITGFCNVVFCSLDKNTIFVLVSTLCWKQYINSSGVFAAWPPVSCQMDDCRNKRNVKAIKVSPRREISVVVAAPVSQSRRFGSDCILSELSYFFPPHFAVSSTGVWIKLI